MVCIYLNRSRNYFYAVSISLVVLLSTGIAFAFGSQRLITNTNFGEPQLKKEKGKANQEKLNFIQSEINKISADLKWLTLRVQKLVEKKRFVPDKMVESLEFKQSKINILTKLKQEIEILLTKEKSGTDKSLTPEPQLDKHLKCNWDLIEKKITKFGLADWVELVKNQDHLRIENRLPILFASGSADIAQEYKSFFESLSSVVKDCNVRIFIDGYADIDPIHTPKFPSNFELGATRAANVVHALIKTGLNPAIFKIGSTGQYRSSKHKASKWKSLERHVNISVEFH